ncbi:MAG: DUF475 domain-containing protein [Desulfotomaculaceae bacterium]|nr:DUF475 domain-containing protein [Desulfotomaculaceae bacterium]
MSKLRCAVEIFVIFAVSWVVEFLYMGLFGVLKGTTLSIMEVSLSFDNAALNALILYTMSPKWRRRFIIWGIPIAVFGMRFVFPAFIVSIISGIDPVSTTRMAFNQPELYAHYLQQGKHMIEAFGGVFLTIIFVKWLYGHKENYWLTYIEKPFTKLGNLSNLAGLTILGIIFLIGVFQRELTIVMACIAGFIVYEAIDSLKGMLESNKIARNVQGVQSTNRNSSASDLGKFIYLEVLDSSLSFDGVIAAFAISQDIVLIVVGLGVGAFAIRTLTIFFVEQSTMELSFLENGAHWAIGFLGAYMLASMFVVIPDYLVSIVTMGVIVLAIISSLRKAKLKKEVEV